ncbi:MAG: cytochrome P450 [Myxococcota bacterium]|nr:cytochrome P450 [Myxococcota bacterium]
MAKNPDLEEGRVSLFDADFARCPQPVYAALRDHCPVSRALLTGAPVVSRYHDVMWALRQPEIFSSAMEMQLALGTDRPMIPQQIDPPEQTRYRRLLDPHFSRRKMEELVPAIRAEADALIDRFEKNGEVEFNEAFAVPLPCSAFLSLLGLPHSDLDFFLGLKDGIIRPQKTHPEEFEGLSGVESMEKGKEMRSASGRKIYEYFEAVIDDRTAKKRDDLMTRLVHAEIEGEKLSREEILDICFLLLLAGLDTVTATVGCNIAYLADNPEQRRRIVADPGLIPGAVEELLRWETPVTAVPRVVKKDVEIRGFQLKEGDLVTLLLGAANIDDEHFEGAEAVDFERGRNIHLSFGGGPHRCLGSHLARMELQVAMEEWHRRIPEYRIREGETPRYSPGIREVMYLPLTWEPGSRS